MSRTRSSGRGADPAVARVGAPDIVGDLRARIASGDLPAGTRLPSELELAARQGSSRSAVRTALAALARQGLVESRPGTGWFVQSAQTQGFDRMRSFTQWADGRGRESGGRIVERATRLATAREARLLGIRTSDEVLHTVRVRTLEGRDVMIERSTWAPWVVRHVEDMPDDIRSTTRLLADAGILITHGNHRIEAVAASSDDARLLGIRRSSPMLQVRRETYAANGRPVECGEDRYVPHTISFEAQAAGAADLPEAS
ncbi:GntR family transcriptional regulator [Agromyces protaetiae]|uniref:GntR family transcriptional regulator n=1 Tax=Agromyces protaetiae TaxID=2509455 RepID=A0A4P6FDD8_9MICO|nr:GntR family transcriptional regulator [Agromyces protaetiae]QAY72379.1 GntR family transcriptional regulator [Agromyces protaetiae]